MAAQLTLLWTVILAATATSVSAQSRSIYVSDGGNFNLPPWQILKFDEDGSNGQVFISDHLAWPQDIVFLEMEEEVLISNLNSGNISRFHADSGTYIDEFATGISGPTRMKFGDDGLLYVLQWSGNGKVLRYQRDGTFVDAFTSSGVGTSIGLDWDKDGNLYVSSYNGKLVRRFSPDGSDMGNFISTDLQGPTNIWFAPNGELFVMDYNAGEIKRFDSEGHYLGVFISGVSQCEGVDFLPNGNIIIGAGQASAVKAYTSDGTFIKDLVPPETLDLILPNAVVIRNMRTSSTAQTGYLEIPLATPSVGNRFHIALSSPVTSQKIEVFDVNGQVVDSIPVSESLIWDAGALPGGVYYITAKLPDGAIARQEIVIQR